MTGIVVWEDNDKARSKSWVTMEYAYMKYSDVCSKKDQYNWKSVDKFLESVASRGHQGVIRFRYTYVGESCAVPAYIKALSDYKATWGDSEDEETEFPDWRCTELQRFHMEFHRLLAERYDSDPRLAFLQTGFGLWAEYHIYDGPFILGQTFPSKAFQSEFLQAMDGWFTKTPWSISIDAADAKYAPFHEEPALLELGFGNFDDSFMCKAHDKENLPNWQFFGEERYKRAPLGGEFSYYSSSDQKHCLDKEGMHGRVFEDEVARYHMTYIIGDGQYRYQTDSRLTEASLCMGYRFELRSAELRTGEAALTVANTGVAPIYYDAYLTFDGHRSDFNLRTLLPGQEQRILVPLPANLPSKHTIRIVSDALLEGKTIPYDVKN